MKHYLRFVAIGLVLGLFTEIVFRLIATVNPKAFLAAVFLYPVILTLAYAAHKLIGRVISPQWRGDVLHYLACGLCGLGVEWILLGNGPDSNAFQLGMFGMWTTFCFGPRVLTRESPSSAGARRKFWLAFGLVAVLSTAIVHLTKNPDAKFVIAVLGLSATNIVWSVWLLVIAWRAR